MKNQRSTHLNRYTVIAVFSVLTVLTMVNVLELIPYFAPFVASPLFSLFHDSHDLIALIMALYIAHKFSPGAGWGIVAWILAIHIPYLYVISPNVVPELIRLAMLTIAAVIGVQIISIRTRLEMQLKKLASDFEVQRADALQRAEELAILNGIAIVGVEATDLDTLIKNAAQILENVLHPDFLDIGMVDEAAGMMRFYDSAHNTNKERLTLTLGRGVAGQVVASGKPRRLSDVRLEPEYLAVNPDMRSELCVPLKVGEHVIGLINIESKQLDAFSEADEHLMTTFAGQLVTIIEKVRLFQLAQHHAQEAETLRQAGAVVASTLRQDEAIERILVQLERVVPYDSASVQLLGDGYLEIVGGRGWPDPSAVIGMRFPIPGDNPNTVVIQQRKPNILGDAPSVYAAFREGTHAHIHSFLGVPLIVADQVIGMLAVDNINPNFYTSGHARLVGAFADQVALAIQNARLFGEVQQLARTDSLTGLHNRRNFMELAQREFGRARRHQHPLTAIMLDIDHFKKVNDNYGHAVGDQVLQIVAARCRETVREIDILGRYGGEEFVVLLLETDIDGARIIAERLRQCVTEPPIDINVGSLVITVSLGIANLDQECTDLDDLLRRADQALYVSKQNGRNQVSIWQE